MPDTPVPENVPPAGDAVSVTGLLLQISNGAVNVIGLAEHTTVME